jgi:hypothetical protein
MTKVDIPLEANLEEPVDLGRKGPKQHSWESWRVRSEVKEVNMDPLMNRFLLRETGLICTRSLWEVA